MQAVSVGGAEEGPAGQLLGNKDLTSMNNHTKY